jgi:hypothetical protein
MMARHANRRLIEMPTDLLTVELEQLPELGLSLPAMRRLRAYLADLPLIPRARDSRALVGPARLTSPALMVVARRVGQAYRSHNISLRDRAANRHQKRLKLGYLRAETLVGLAKDDWRRVLSESAVFVAEAVGTHVETLERLLAKRAPQDLPTFVACEVKLNSMEVIELVDCHNCHSERSEESKT